MKKMKILIVIFVIIISLFFLLRLKPKTPSPTSTSQPSAEGFLFMDDYEDNPEIVENNLEIWMQVIRDTKKGNYWSEKVHWLEGAKSIGKGYQVDPGMGNAIVTSDVSHSGNKSVEMTVSGVPSEYTYVVSYLARYIRNQSKIKDGVYEIGVWFYVPKGNTPVIVFGMENHPSWLNQYFAYAGVKTEDGSIYFMDDNKMVTIGNVNFQYDTWFKMWIVWDIRKERFTLYYKSPTEEKTFDVDQVWGSGPNLSYIGYQAFNFYAGAGNIHRDKQKFYVDDLYAKMID